MKPIEPPPIDIEHGDLIELDAWDCLAFKLSDEKRPRSKARAEWFAREGPVAPPELRVVRDEFC